MFLFVCLFVFFKFGVCVSFFRNAPSRIEFVSAYHSKINLYPFNVFIGVLLYVTGLPRIAVILHRSFI